MKPALTDLRKSFPSGHPIRRRGVALVVFFALATAAARGEESNDVSKTSPIEIIPIKRDTPVDFAKEILPILQANCLACHNAADAKADLVLETPSAILKGGENGPAAVPGKGLESLIVKVSAKTEKPFMPPKNNKSGANPLTPQELGLLKLWIDQGAKAGIASSAPASATPAKYEPLPESLKAIYAIAISPDGEMAACNRANQIFVYNLATRRLVARLSDSSLVPGEGRPGVAHRDVIQSLAFSPDGKTLASGAFREVKLWQRPEPPVRFTAAGLVRSRVTSMVQSRDEKWVAVGGDDGVIRLVNSADGKVRSELKGPDGDVTALAISADGETLFSASIDRSIRAWKTADGSPAGRIDTPGPVTSLVLVTVDGRQRIITAGGGDVIRVWAIPDAVAIDDQPLNIGTFSAQNGPILCLASSTAKSSHFFSGSADGMVREWDGSTGTIIRQIGAGESVRNVSVSPDEKTVAAMGATSVKLFDAASGAVFSTLRGDRTAQQAAQLGQRKLDLAKAEIAICQQQSDAAAQGVAAEAQSLAAATAARPAAEKLRNDKKAVFDAKRAAKAALELAVAEAQVSLGSARDFLDVANVADVLTAADPAAKQFAVELPAAEKELADAAKAFEAADRAVSLSQKTSARAAEDAAIRKASLGVAVATLPQRQATLDAALAGARAEVAVSSLAFSADGQTVYLGGADGTVRSYGLDGTPADAFAGHTGAVTAISVAANDLLLTGSTDRGVRSIDPNPAWTLKATIGTGDDRSPLADRVLALSFSPDGSLLATGGGVPSRSGELKLWSASTGQLFREFPNAHIDTVFGISFSGDGTRIASGGADKFARVWDVSTGALLRNFEGHTHHVTAVSLRHDGRTLVTGGADSAVRVWDIETGAQRLTNATFSKFEITRVQHVGFTDRFLITTGEGNVRLIREADLAVEKAFDLPPGETFTNAGSVTPDGSRLLFGGEDGILRFRDARDGKVLGDFAFPAMSVK